MIKELMRYLQLGSIVEIMYMDRSNQITKRKVKLISIEGDHVRTFCYARRAPRYFVINNILAIGLPSTNIKKRTS